MCQRENGVTEVFSLLFFSLSVYDVQKKALYGWNMLDCTETRKRTQDIIVKKTCLPSSDDTAAEINHLYDQRTLRAGKREKTYMK